MAFVKRFEGISKTNRVAACETKGRGRVAKCSVSLINKHFIYKCKQAHIYIFLYNYFFN